MAHLDTSLRRMIAEENALSRLTESEANIVRMTANGCSPQRIASLYGFQNAADAERAIGKITAKLEGKPSPAAGTVNGNGRAGDSSQTTPARPSVAPSTRGSHAPADARRDAILAYVREHGTARTRSICIDVGIPHSTTLRLCNELIAAGELERHGYKSTAHYRLPGADAALVAVPAAKPSRPKPPPPFAGTREPSGIAESQPRLLDRYVELLLAYLEGAAEGGSPGPEALMDRIERVLGIAA